MRAGPCDWMILIINDKNIESLKKIILIAVIVFGIVSFEKPHENNANPLKVLKKICKNYSNGVLKNEQIITYNYDDSLVLKSIITTVDNLVTENVEVKYLDGKIHEMSLDMAPTKNSSKYSIIVTYNYTGDLITSSLNNENGVTRTDVYIYNTLRQVIEMQSTRNGELLGRTKYKYYENGNLSKAIYHSDSYQTKYKKYDDKRNPFELIFTPAYLKNYIRSINNIKSSVVDGKYETYEYEYNSYNYPTKIVERVDGKLNNITTIEYNQ